MMRTSTRHRLTAALTVAVSALTVSACAGGGTTGSSSSAAADSTLTAWLWPGAVGDDVLASVTSEFTADKLQISTIGDSFKQKLVTVFTGKSGIPSITGIKGEDMPYFRQQADLFTDLKTLGIDDLLSQYPAWKLAEATTDDGKLIGLPLDIGPTGMFYRTDVLAAAGLPTDPAELAAATATWEDFFTFGEKLKAATGAFLEVSLGDVFSKSIAQSETGFVSESGEFLGDSPAVKAAWDRAIEANTRGLSANLEDGSPDWASAVNAGQLPTLLGAAWAAGDIKGAAPDTAGKWNVTTTPGGPANIGGSFLTIPAGTADAAAAIKVIRSLLDPKNQAITYSQVGNFPSSSKALTETALTQGDAFFGGQVTAPVFEKAVEAMPTRFTSPFDSEVSAAYYTELTNVASQGKDPAQAWADAVAAAKQALESSQ